MLQYCKDFMATGLLSIILLTMACGTPEEGIDNEFSKQVFLRTSADSSFCFSLDSLSHPYINYFQIIDSSGLSDPVFVFLNEYNSSLYFYDIKTKVLKDIVSPFSDHGAMPKIGGFYYKNVDTILLIPEYGSKFYLCNSFGIVYSRTLVENYEDLVVSQWVSNSSPIYIYGDVIYINNVFGFLAEEDNDHAFLLLEFNLGNSLVKGFIKHPSETVGLNLSASTFRHMNWTLDVSNDAILYGFNYSPMVYRFDLGTNRTIDTIYFKYPSYKPIDPVPRSDDPDLNWIHFQSNLSFSKLAYDRFRGGIVRFVMQPNNYDELMSGMLDPEEVKEVNLVRYDTNGNYIGEISLGSSYLFKNCFFDESGIWIQKLTTNEDELCFSHFNL